MPRPVPTALYHFTHLDHLPTIMSHGLLSDTRAQVAGLVRTEVGDRGIKDWRRRRRVPVPPGGVVADYAPFYFASRSPMMYKIHVGGVPTYGQGCDDLVYLVTTVERLVALRELRLVFTDRNAALGVATFTDDLNDLEQSIDWALMRARMWSNTVDEPDRMERRMAEVLVHERVPWPIFSEIVTKTPACARRVREVVATVGGSTPVRVVPSWYF